MTDRIEAWLKEKESLEALAEKMDETTLVEAMTSLIQEAESILDNLNKN